MSFINPIWLWALTGLAIPVGIHLLSRKEGKVIPIGSLRYLRESPTARFRHIRLNEIVLLILRCLLLVLIVLLMAGLTLDLNEFRNKKWLVVEKGIENSERYKPFIDSLAEHGFELRLLSSEFPLIKDSANTQPPADYWAAAEKLGSFELDSVVVISYSFEKNFTGERISLPPSISWFTEEPNAQSFAAMKIVYRKDSVWTRTGFTSASATKFETHKEFAGISPENQPTPPDTIHISIFKEEKFRYDLKIIYAALDAIQTITPHKIIISSMEGNEPSPADSRWIIWLSDEVFPYPYKKKIVLTDCPIHLPLLTKAENARDACAEIPASGYIITKRLHEDIVLKENFTLRLASILLEETPSPKIIHDNRVLPEQQLWSETNQTGVRFVKSEINNTLNALIIIALMLTLMGERTLAYQRNQ
jgi:hypothetical protein